MVLISGGDTIPKDSCSIWSERRPSEAIFAALAIAIAVWATIGPPAPRPATPVSWPWAFRAARRTKFPDDIRRAYQTMGCPGMVR